MNQQLCPICSSKHLSVFLQRIQVPVHQNLLINDAQTARQVSRGDLELSVCNQCGFVFNTAFDLSLLEYGQNYDNTQTHSAYFDNYLDDLVKHLVLDEGVKHSTIIEIGCGKGDFLKKLLAYPETNNTGIGFDPSYIGPLTSLDGRMTINRCYYDQSFTNITADIVICRHVIEHVTDPLALLRSIRKALVNSPNAKIFFETPCVEWILKNQVVWDFFYEHCSLFSSDSLRLAFELAGFQVDKVETIFGGQYLWLEASLEKPNLVTPISYQHNIAELALSYKNAEHALLSRWQQRIAELLTSGKVALWGAGAKGATMANLVDPQANLIDCIVDLNPNKQGRYIPGSGHPIVSLDVLSNRNIRHVILMNPNYRAENLGLIKQAGIEINLIDWSE